MFGGISLAPGSDARRPQAELPVQDLEALRRLATRRRHLQELMERSEGNAAWAGQVSTMIDGLSPDDAGQLLVQLADGYRKTGRLDLAADTYFLFARRYPDHPLTDQALAVARPVLRQQRNRPAPEASRLSNRLPLGEGRVRRSPLRSAQSHPTSDRYDTHRTKRSARRRPLARRPPPPRRPTRRLSENRSPRAVRRTQPSASPKRRPSANSGFANPAQRFYLTLRDFPKPIRGVECAATEEWLAQPAELPPSKKSPPVAPISEPPNLDGNLDEPFWTKADRLRLSDKSSVAPTHQAAKYSSSRDNEFLYSAIRCPKQESIDYRTDDTPRPRDADLTQHDRVTLRLDTDRDYTTAFELSVDNRGWTHDACWGDPNWNPAWYVAAAGDDTTWTIEAAIPLTELVDKPPAARTVWAVSARRTIPRVGYQTWSGTPTSDDSPAQFGMLIFE